jgi:sulfoxide reductase heme-binding subunit YedZ
MLSRLSPYLLWALLALPSFGMVIQALTSETTTVYSDLLHPSGEFAARFMIIALMATPLMMLFRGWRGARWLVRNRRYFGVAAFGYAALHTALYLLAEPLNRILAEATALEIWTGWLAFVIFLPLAATSNDWAVRRLGTRWKRLQRWTYGAAVLTLLHWATLNDWGSLGAAAVHFAPLVALSAYRVWWVWLRPHPVQMA